MPKQERFKTKYQGIYYIMGTTPDGRPERIYYMQYRKDGRSIEEKAGRQFLDNMTAAKAAGKRLDRKRGREKTNKEIRKEEEALANRWTIARLWEEYKRQNPIKGLAQDESRYLRYIKPRFAEKEPSELASLDVDRLRLRLQREKSPQTVKNTLALLRRIVTFGAKKGLCQGMGFVIQMPARIQNVKTEDLSDEELTRLLAALDNDPDIQITNLMRLVLCTGMRRGELFRLQWRHIDYDRGFIEIVDPKGGPNQKIPLNDAAREIFLSHPKTSGSPFVFPGRGGKQRVEIRKAANRIKKAAGLPDDFRPLHGLRHTYASMLASSGKVDLYTLQKLLTHKSPEMTQRYAHLRDRALRDASELAGDIIQQAVLRKDDAQDTGKVIPLQRDGK